MVVRTCCHRQSFYRQENKQQIILSLRLSFGIILCRFEKNSNEKSALKSLMEVTFDKNTKTTG